MIGAEAGVTAEIGDTGDTRTMNAVVRRIAEEDIASENETPTHGPTNAETEATARIPESDNIAAAALSGAEKREREAAAPKQGEKGVTVLRGRRRGAIDPVVEAPRCHDATGEMIKNGIGIGIGEAQARNIELLRVGGVDLLIRESGIGRVDDGMGRGGDE